MMAGLVGSKGAVHAAEADDFVFVELEYNLGRY